MKNYSIIQPFDSSGNTATLTDTQGNVIVGYLYDLNNGKIVSEYNPQGIDNPYKGSGKNGVFTIYIDSIISIILNPEGIKSSTLTPWGYMDILESSRAKDCGRGKPLSVPPKRVVIDIPERVLWKLQELLIGAVTFTSFVDWKIYIKPGNWVVGGAQPCVSSN